MSISENYWRSIFTTLLSYLSILMIMSGAAFIIAGRIASPLYYMGLLAWPLFIMLGIVNLRYIGIISRTNRQNLKKTLNNQ